MHSQKVNAMKSIPFRAVAARAGRLVAGAVVLVATVVLAACGGGGTTPVTGVDLRPLSAEFTSRKAVAYSPYRTATSVDGLGAEVITEAQIKQDLDLLIAAGFGLIRVFDSDDKVGKQTLQVIEKFGLNLRMQLGIYVQSGQDSYNQTQLARGVTLANRYADIVLAVSIGNETMVTWSFNKIDPQVMGGYIAKVRGQIAQPVTTDDNWAFWASAPTSITDVIDFAALHTYAELDSVFIAGLWDWQQLDKPEAQRAAAMMDAAIAETRRQYGAARASLDGRGLSAIPIVIGETGWNAVDVGRLPFRAHPVNQKMYLDRLNAWAAEGRAGAGPKAIFYFEAFDEPWKQGDDKWGLFNVQRQARYAIQSLGTCGTTWACEPGAYTDADAVYFVAPVVNTAVAANKYTLYSEAVATTTEFRPVGLSRDAFDGTTAAAPEVGSTAAPGDASQSLEITPQPKNYGWGLLFHSRTAVTENLSAFAASGNLVFSIKTAYPGKIEIGVSSDTQDRAPAEAYLQIGPGDYGYCNTDTWCQVTIPLKDFVAKNPKLDLSLVLARFVIADRYAFTDKPANANLTNKLYIDAAYWSR